MLNMVSNTLINDMANIVRYVQHGCNTLINHMANIVRYVQHG